MKFWKEHALQLNGFAWAQKNKKVCLDQIPKRTEERNRIKGEKENNKNQRTADHKQMTPNFPKDLFACICA